MDSKLPQGRRAKIRAEAIVEITDEDVVIGAALADLEQVEFTVDGEREARQVEIKRDAVAAVGWLVDSFGLLPAVPGAQVVHSEDQTVEVNEAGQERSTIPDFVALFPTCRCNSESCDACSGYQLTPRTAAVLWTLTQIIADHAYEDVIEHGDGPVLDNEPWMLFDRYPRITWRQDAVWRRQAARAFDDLTEDLAAGSWPHPSCPGEEMALHLVLEAAPDAVADGWAGLDQTLPRLPEHPDDYDWDLASEVFFQDHDILDLFEVEMDGIEDPDSEQNRIMGMGDYRPLAWFRTFLNKEPRDGRRPFRC
jgi:hypothetical protein